MALTRDQKCNNAITNLTMLKRSFLERKDGYLGNVMIARMLGDVIDLLISYSEANDKPEPAKGDD